MHFYIKTSCLLWSYSQLTSASFTEKAAKHFSFPLLHVIHVKCVINVYMHKLLIHQKNVFKYCILYLYHALP